MTGYWSQPRPYIVSVGMNRLQRWAIRRDEADQ